MGVLLEDLLDGQAQRHQLLANAQEARSPDDHVGAPQLDDPELDGTPGDLGIDHPCREERGEAGGIEDERLLHRPDQLRLETENVAQSGAPLPCVHQRPNGGQGEPSFLEAGDETQPGQVGRPVVSDPPLDLGPRKQALVW